MILYNSGFTEDFQYMARLQQPLIMTCASYTKVNRIVNCHPVAQDFVP